jgi:hypothetical protein
VNNTSTSTFISIGPIFISSPKKKRVDGVELTGQEGRIDILIVALICIGIY